MGQHRRSPVWIRTELKKKAALGKGHGRQSSIHDEAQGCSIQGPRYKTRSIRTTRDLGGNRGLGYIRHVRTILYVPRYLRTVQMVKLFEFSFPSSVDARQSILPVSMTHARTWRTRGGRRRAKGPDGLGEWNQYGTLPGSQQRRAGIVPRTDKEWNWNWGFSVPEFGGTGHKAKVRQDPMIAWGPCTYLRSCTSGQGRWGLHPLLRYLVEFPSSQTGPRGTYCASTSGTAP